MRRNIIMRSISLAVRKPREMERVGSVYETGAKLGKVVLNFAISLFNSANPGFAHLPTCFVEISIELPNQGLLILLKNNNIL